MDIKFENHAYIRDKQYIEWHEALPIYNKVYSINNFHPNGCYFYADLC